MMNPVELRKLRDWAPLPIVIIVIMYFAPAALIEPVEDNLRATLRAFDQNIMAAADTLHKRTEDRDVATRASQMRVRLDRMDRWLPPADFLPNVIDEMNGLAKLVGVKLSSVDYRFDKAARIEGAGSDNGGGNSGGSVFGSGGSVGMPPRVSLKLRLRADYAAMRTFLQAIESLPFPLVPVEIVAGENREFLIDVMHFVRPKS
ncbi:MAG: hypothetical protein WA705_25940 [Candidatus Ozemobacteraceae bacterium]